jgi:hypothetical protein
MDYSELLSAIAGNNPWLSTGSAIAQAPMAYNENSSFGTNLGLGILQGALAGGLQGYGKKQTLDDFGTFQSIIKANESPMARIEAIKGNDRLSFLSPLLQLQELEKENKMRDLIIKNEAEKQALRNQKTVELEFTPKIEAAKAKELLPIEQQRLFQTQIAPKLMAEQGIQQNTERAKATIADAFDSVGEAGFWGGNLTRTGSKKVEAAQAAIWSALQAGWKGVMSEPDAKKLEALIPRTTDSKEQREDKKQRMLGVLELQSDPTPYLKSGQYNYGGAPTQAAKPDLSSLSNEQLDALIAQAGK